MSPDATVAAFLDRELEAQTAFLAELVKVPSDNPPGDCAPHAERAATLLEELGWQVERHSVPDDLTRANGMVSCVNLVVRRRFGEGGPVIALNAHGDVVPPGEGWTRDPYGAEVVDGWMYGRGVAVSKSDFATYAWALRALEEAERTGTPLSGTIELHLTYDEEAGGEIGTGFLLEQGISKPDLALGAGFSYAVVTAHNGCLHLEVQVDGRSAHAAMPFTGVDALEAATAVLSELYRYRHTLGSRQSGIEGIGSPQITVGLIKGGINTNVVPDRVTFRLDRRMIPEERPEKGGGGGTAPDRTGGQELPESPGHHPPHPPGPAPHPAPRRRAPYRGSSAGTPAASWASPSPPRASPSTPTPATTPRRASLSPSTVQAPTRSRKPTRTAPTSASSSPTGGKRPRS